MINKITLLMAMLDQSQTQLPKPQQLLLTNRSVAAHCVMVNTAKNKLLFYHKFFITSVANMFRVLSSLVVWAKRGNSCLYISVIDIHLIHPWSF